MIPEYSEIPELIRAEMRRLQKAAQGKVDESVFEKNTAASKTSGGFDWPREQLEAWSDALAKGQFDALLKILEKPKRKYTKKAEKPEPKRKYTKKAEAEPIEGAAAPAKSLVLSEADRRFKAEGWFKSEAKQAEKAEQAQPSYYKQLKGGDVLDMMLAVYGREAVKNFCELNAFKYRMRAGRKNTETVESDISKALFYEEKAKELCGAEK